ncbi:MAG: NTP transferase domain-containing protein [Bacteroidales bacterium]|nr:NTP transferase domain-containing protein [Bacteroidales bacterium]
MDKNNYGVIMAGGVGARFWPMSRTMRPKQFIDILGTGETLIQQTFRRLSVVCPPENIFVVTHELYKDLVIEQLPLIIPDHVLCEPVRRNTAPCIAYACHKIAHLNPDARIVVAPSDHIILKEEIFTKTLRDALDAVSVNDWLITLGIMPSRPDTGYGYIQFDETKEFKPHTSVRKVKTFTEKPHHELAVSFLQSGDFLWNSGIFIWSLRSILNAFDKHLAEVNSIFREGDSSYFTPMESDYILQAYTLCKSISIDYGVMEKADNVYVIPSDFGWSDLGTWGSLYEARIKNEDNNAIVGDSVIPVDTKNCIITMPDHKVALIQGLDNYIIVDEKDVLLICRKGDEQNIRNYVDEVRERKGDKYV